MADNSTCPYGAKFSIGDFDTSNPETPPGSYAEFGQLVETAFPEITVAEIKATRLNQADMYKRKRPGFLDAGKVPVQVYYDKADYALLKGYVDARAEKWFKVEAPEDDDPTHTSKCQFHGFFSKLGQTIPNPDDENGMISMVEITVNGKPQFTAYS